MASPKVGKRSANNMMSHSFTTFAFPNARGQHVC